MFKFKIFKLNRWNKRHYNRLWFWGLCIIWWFRGISAVDAAGSTIWGGSLLEQGEVAISCGGGFADVLCQFDFANSKQFNLAMRARANYNLGIPLWGFVGVISSPMRLSLWNNPKWNVALHLEPAVWMGGGPEYGFHIGFAAGVGGIVDYKINTKWTAYWGLELMFMFGFEAGTPLMTKIGRGTFSLILPIEFVGGIDYHLNQKFSLFARLALGPMLYTGMLGGVVNRTADVAASGSLRLWLGLTWRRNG